MFAQKQNWSTEHAVAQPARQKFNMILTPEIAQDWISQLVEHEEANGPRLSKMQQETHVNTLAEAMICGEWRLTHQGILLGRDGLLLDGRHRALAVIKSGVSIPIEVTIDESFGRAVELEGVDVDGAQRDHSFTTGYPKPVTQVARHLLNFVNRKIRPRSSVVGQVSAQLYPSFEFLESRVSHRRFRASTYKAAFILRIMDAKAKNDWQDMTELKAIYASLCDNDPRTLPPLVYSFYRQLTDGFPRLWRALDPKDRDIAEKLIIRNLSVTTGLIRKEIVRLVPAIKAP